MTDPEVLLTGRSASVVAWRRLQAGPTTVFLDGIDLRRIRAGGRELVSQVYVAVRDATWNTCPPTVHDLVVHQDRDGFLVTFTARHRGTGIAFDWNGSIVGLPDGSLTYEMDGAAGSAFDFNRIGINVLIRADLAVGRPYRAGGAESVPVETEGVFDRRIVPQAIVGGRLSGMFPPLREMEVDLTDDATLRLEFEGGDFEAEDQRNFGDSTFKVYSTPVAWPTPVRAIPGGQIHQSVGIAFSGPAAELAEDADVAVRVGEPTGRLPAIGFGCAGHGEPLSGRELRLLATLHPAHLRLELGASDPQGQSRVGQAADQARALGCRLEVDLSLGPDTEADLDRAITALKPAASLLEAVLVRAPSDEPFDSGPPGRVVRAARDRLAVALGGVRVGVASTFLAPFNRSAIPVGDVGCVEFSVCATTHRSDDATMTDNLIWLGTEIETARARAAGAPIRVGPVSLTSATGPFPNGPGGNGGLPDNVDVRQPSLLGAAWTVGAIAELAAAGPEAITCYETTGWRGVLERDAGSPLPERFPSHPGTVFPMWHVFADLAEWRDGELLTVSVSDPLRATALAVRDAGGTRVLIANLARESSEVVLGGLPAGPIRARRLGADQAVDAMSDPDGFRRRRDPVERAPQGGIRMLLSAYEIVRLDIEVRG